MRKTLVFGLLALYFGLAVVAAQQCTVYVSQDGGRDVNCGSQDKPCATISEGVSNAKDGDVVCVSAGREAYRCPYQDGIIVNKSLALYSIGGLSPATIDCKGEGRAFLIEGSNTRAMLYGFVFINGAHAEGGGAIVVDDRATLVVRGCIFERHNSSLGGAIRITGNSTVAIRDSAFAGSNASRGGAIYSDHSNVTVLRCTFSHHRATSLSSYGGGTIYVEENSHFALGSSTFSFSFANATGGTVFVSETPSVEVRNCSFTNCSTTHHGGGLMLFAGLNTTITNCTFEGNNALFSGGAMFLNQNTVTMSDISFINNAAGGTGGAVALYTDFPAQSSAAIENCRFNLSYAQNGGGLFSSGNITLSLRNATFHGNRAGDWGGAIHALENVRVRMEGCSLINNSAEIGGAITLDSCNDILFHDSSFSSNQAVAWGGAIYASNNTNIAMTTCEFFNSSATTGGAVYMFLGSLLVNASNFNSSNAVVNGVDIYSFASTYVHIHGTSFEETRSGSFIEVPQTASLEISTEVISCPVGASYFNKSQLYEAALPDRVTRNITTSSLLCSRCEIDKYSLSGAYVIQGELHNIPCHLCPGYADCSRGGSDIYYLPGFWCYRLSSDSSMLDCVRCPDGFCKQASGPWDTACSGNREGVLCGRCKDGYSQAFGTPECLADDNCHAFWFIPVIFIVAMIYTILSIVFRFSSHALWKSLLYFMQVAPLIAYLDNRVVGPLQAIFSLDASALGVNVGVCPWPGITGWMKIASGYFIPLILLGQLGTIWIVAVMARFLCKYAHPPVREESSEHSLSMIQEDDSTSFDSETVHLLPGPKTASFFEKVQRAFVGLCLLMYVGLSGTTASLLRCTHVDGELRLYGSGDIKCYTGIQIVIFVLAAALLCAPMALFYVQWRLHKANRTTDDSPTLEVLEVSYKPERRYWEIFVLYRRIVLLALAITIPDPLWQAVALFLGCFGIFMLHLYVQPYKSDQTDELVERWFLLNLTVIAALQLPIATCLVLGQVYTTSMDALGYIQAALVIVPLLVYCWYGAQYIINWAVKVRADIKARSHS